MPVVDFGNSQEAYRSRHSWELARNLLVLRLCASPTLLARHEQVRGRAGGWLAGWVGGQVGRWAGGPRLCRTSPCSRNYAMEFESVKPRALLHLL